ncbi:dna polymerase iii subunit delta [Leptolyngbya sp. Heron Island J]|uniref:DNA polymerase III subunit delta n=1 Tax=Leptolyngbya sp. Heron Island J TaxID=1385935 RepID=UPI0003B99EA7|nr:DNA polymerase III subunit delta [Leptolyngbya sp. Heron Island J]ESA39068.1 dna polymerase iii subunit delta [Leptolyngbya sp. Heron Island J]
MPVYFFWGADEFRMKKAVRALCDRNLNPDWASFNYEKIPPEQSNALIQGLNQAMTPPFGMGKRVVWLVDTPICQRCSADLLTELERTLPNIPTSSILLLTSSNKPDGRLKSTKLVKKYADIREFETIPPWKTEQIEHQVYQVAKDVGLQLTPQAAALLGEVIGADTRRLYNELEKLKTYWTQPKQALPPEAVHTLVATSTQSSLKLAAALREGHTDRALTLVTELLERNEPALRIVATLVGQFRTWLWVKLMTESGERDTRIIAQAAEVGNPKRIYFLQKELRNISSRQLQNALKLLLALEYSLKQGAPETVTLHTKVIELAHCFQSA